MLTAVHGVGQQGYITTISGSQQSKVDVNADANWRSTIAEVVLLINYKLQEIPEEVTTTLDSAIRVTESFL